MVQNALDKHCRRGISLVELIRVFPHIGTTHKWIESYNWPDDPVLPRYDSRASTVQVLSAPVNPLS